AGFAERRRNAGRLLAARPSRESNMFRTPGWLGLIVAVAVAGCAPAPKTGKVSGQVTLDGQPLKEGRVQFIPVAGDTGTAGAIITDGKFSIDVPITKMRVEINANKVVGSRKA